MILEGLLYTKSHEWVKVEGKHALVGITDHAQENLGSIVFIELPKTGKSFTQGDAFGAVESVKAASDLYLPISGTVVEVNNQLEDAPELLNEDAYANWIAKIEIQDESELSSLLTSDQYVEACDI